MKLRTTTNYVSGTVIGSYLWQVKRYMMGKYGCGTADREIDPLVWYISTGRAPTQFIGLLIQKKPYMIGRILHKGGSTDEAIARVKEYIGFEEEDE